MTGKIHIGVLIMLLLLVTGGVYMGFLAQTPSEFVEQQSESQDLVIPDVAPETMSSDDTLTMQAPDALPSTVDLEAEADQQAAQEPLPALEQSDALLRADLLALAPQFKTFLFQDQLLSKYIFALNDMAQGARPANKWLRELNFAAPFAPQYIGERVYLSTLSYQRYDRLAQAIAGVDNQALVALYQKYLPLTNSVFAGFSYPADYKLLDIVKAAVAKVLQAPVIEQPIELVRPSVSYKFADPRFEKMSSLDKQMLRMGPDNTRLIQDELRSLMQDLLATVHE